MFANFFLYLRLLGFTLSFSLQRLSIYLSTKIHRLTYHSVPDPRNVVIIGGSFAGYFLAKRLAESLPTGYRVVLIERHSHFHFTWNFPRASVLPGQEANAIIPYPGPGPRSAPEGAYVFKQGTVAAIASDKVILQDGSEIAYEYLAVATGSRLRYPAKLDGSGGGGDGNENRDGNVKANCVRFFQKQQQRIAAGQDIVVVGGGAAGVEVAADIKSKYPQKSVTLVHSRENLLNSFDRDLHDIARKALEELGVTLFLGERVVGGLDGDDSQQAVTLRSGRVIQCDTVIKCTGQAPNSGLVAAFSPPSVSATNGAILVDKALRVRNTPSRNTHNIFALGDVVDLPGPKMGRAAAMQAFLVAENIGRAIQAGGRTTNATSSQSSPVLKEYTPSMVDSSIELTLGLGKSVNFISDRQHHVSFGRKMPDDSLHAAQMWRMMDAQPFVDPGDNNAATSAVVEGEVAAATAKKVELS